MDSADHARLVAEAARRGMSPANLARAYPRAGLHGVEDTAPGPRREAALAALDELAGLRARLPAAPPLDVVQVVQEGREHLRQRTTP